MDVGISKPFKDNMHKLYEEFMVNSDEEKLKSGWLDVVWWVDNAWNNLNKNVIHKTWKHIGIAGREEVNLI